MTNFGFSEQYAEYLVPDDLVMRAAFTDAGLIVLDANVLLNLYRFASGARNELLTVLDKIRQQIWIPHRVGHEFFRNRLTVIAELGTSYFDLKKQIDVRRRVGCDLDSRCLREWLKVVAI